MPEGDTIARIAAVIGKELGGATVRDLAYAPPHAAAERIRAATLVQARAAGKHLLLEFDNAWCVHSHLGMTGSWHLYAHGRPWRKPARRMALRLVFDGRDLLCFSPRILVIDTIERVRRDRMVAGLGEDVLDASFDPDAAREALRRMPRLAIGEAVMDQRLVAGIGNVYKSELLFLARLDPRRPVSECDDDAIDQLLQLARHWLRRNLGGQRRRLRYQPTGDRLWVYRREGLPCLTCATPIALIRQGLNSRSTYFCPNCQSGN